MWNDNKQHGAKKKKGVKNKQKEMFENEKKETRGRKRVIDDVKYIFPFFHQIQELFSIFFVCPSRKSSFDK